MNTELMCKIFDSKQKELGGMKRVSSSVKLTSNNKNIEALCLRHIRFKKLVLYRKLNI